jgi:serine/threonine protein kinase/tetratricopeptide (TPR) repeat protein
MLGPLAAGTTVLSIAEPQKCSRCGAELAADVRGGQCLRCLLLLALTPPDALAPSAPPTQASESGSPGEKPGDHIGRFQLLKQIGQGGFGVVFEARQEEPVQRLVALKVIKVGIDDEQTVRRFESERQTLALLEHANIAKIFDGGTTASGRPYFVMELLAGEKITDYCNHHHLSVRERLDLFVQVCHAIQHAHQKGIIHRDIKPSNVLVVEQDGQAVPKVIDFGIAKTTIGQRVTEDTMDTVLRGFAGTPAYMSPEQTGLRGMDIDSRSDIYSLGILLYELLTDQAPFGPPEFQRAAVDEIFHIIREREPPRPSTWLTTLDSGRLAAIAQMRQTDPAKLPLAVRGDLDWIVMRALEKDRDRRYETADGLAMDIQRHLHFEPVLARPPSRLYRLRKFIRRNKIGFVAGSAVAITLVSGAVISILLYVQERQARQAESQARQAAVAAQALATAQARESQEVAGFLKEMLNGVSPSVAMGHDTTLLTEILDKTSNRLGQELNDQPEVQADLWDLLGQVYADIGQYPKAENADRQALALARSLPAARQGNVAVSLANLANVLAREGKLKEAEPAAREALDLRRKRYGETNAEVALSLDTLGVVLWHQSRLTEAEPLFRQALEIFRAQPGPLSPKLTEALGNLGVCLAQEGKPAEAEEFFREALAIQKKVLGDHHPLVAHTLGNLANTLHDQGKFAEAETVERQAIALRRQILGNQHPSLSISLYNLAADLVQEGKLTEAEAVEREALAIRRKALGNDHRDTARSLIGLGDVLRLEKRPAEAVIAYTEAVSIEHNHKGNILPDLPGALNGLGRALLDQTNLPAAEAAFRDAAQEQARQDPKSPDLVKVWENLALTLERQNKVEELKAVQAQIQEASREPNPARSSP